MHLDSTFILSASATQKYRRQSSHVWNVNVASTFGTPPRRALIDGSAVFSLAIRRPVRPVRAGPSQKALKRENLHRALCIAASRPTLDVSEHAVCARVMHWNRKRHPAHSSSSSAYMTSHVSERPPLHLFHHPRTRSSAFHVANEELLMKASKNSLWMKKAAENGLSSASSFFFFLLVKKMKMR